MAGEFNMTILGRTIEHLGTQMYKHRAPSIAELVANCWDAGADCVQIDMPELGSYNAKSSILSILDNGEGMDELTVQDKYLVVGRNRRSQEGGVKNNRKIMGRKGIGKLAGFGLAEKVTVTTWTKEANTAIQFSMSLQQLKGDTRTASAVKFPWTEVSKMADWPPSGTLIELSELRHTTSIDISALRETLARRFSRTIRGEMKILINKKLLPEPNIDMMYEFPENKEYEEATLSNGQNIRYRYSFARKPLKSKELQGFVVYANGRTAQAPPFFFNVESTASSQHSTRYITGEIIADVIDSGTDDETDCISTDRQELDWEKDELQPLQQWGDEISRRAMRDCADMRGSQLENWVLNDQEFARRLNLLYPSACKEISRFLKILGQKSEENDERTRSLADSLIRAYEFRTFHDVIDDIEQASQDPNKLEEMLRRLQDWKVLESRAILEIIQGRLSIINKLEYMIINNAPETASSKTYDNMHDLLAEYPWIFNPEWQVFVEEKSLSKQLQEWGLRDCPSEMKSKRVDFLAFVKDTDFLIIIEMKRSGHALEFEETQRLEQYQVELMRARPKCKRVVVFGGQKNIPEEKWQNMLKSEDFEVLTWSKMFARAKSFYSHYKALLDGDVAAEGFQTKKSEVARTRTIIQTNSSHRYAEDRKRGVWSSDA